MPDTATLHTSAKVAEAKPISAVDFALGRIERGIEDHLERKITNWFFILEMFKEAESQYLRLGDEDRKILHNRHRSVLARLMGIGEAIWAAVKCNPETDIEISGYSRNDLQANIRYLRDKYEQWYVPIDDETYRSVSESINNARATT